MVRGGKLASATLLGFWSLFACKHAGLRHIDQRGERHVHHGTGTGMSANHPPFYVYIPTYLHIPTHLYIHTANAMLRRAHQNDS
ncbi:hypothetical protein F5Y04DRAFT_264591 [Hypomontagnella monticulosa]|nr:hypothetical protein F5Y04DRAFT_264591 [Hypomontagnella monticulosa]